MYYIYKIENKINHKKYIGLTNNINRRKARHFTDLKCHRHDNSFLQKEYDIYGEDNFSFSIVFKGDISSWEIGEKEKYFIQLYDSYKNGYNQNEGGNFGPSNGGTHLTEYDILNICSAIEFCSRPGGVLSKIYDVSLTTISRIKHKENHNETINYYESLPFEERKKIYLNFCNEKSFYEKKVKQTILKGKRKLSKEQVFMIFCNSEYKIFTKVKMANIVQVKSTYTIDCILKGETYKDYFLEYQNITNEDKEKIVSLLSNQQKKTL